MKNFIKNIFVFLFPFSIWAYFRKGFLLGEFSFVGDNQQYFFWLQYYLYNIIRGVYTRWNPFFAWGTFDNIDTRIIGDCNPFLQLINIFNSVGISFYHSLILYLFFYYFLGLLGFYFLAKSLFKDKFLAYLSFILLMFSSLGAAIFQQMQILFLYVPGVWFFYFLVGFAQTQHRKYLLGMSFACMILVTTYMPFHFLTIFSAFVFFYTIFYFKGLINFLKNGGIFLGKNKALAIFCIFSVCCAMAPSLTWYFEAKDPHYIMRYERESEGAHSSVVSIEGVNLSSLFNETSFPELFSDLDLGNQQFAYFPIFVFILLLLAVINKGGRRQALLLCMGTLIFLIGSADVTPVHAFLYRHIFFFKLFRNYFYFLPFLIPIVILFAVDQFRILLNYTPRNKRDLIALLALIGILHLGFAFFLYRLGNIIGTSYFTIMASCLFFMLYFLKHLPRRSLLFMAGFFVIVITQPIQVNYHFKHLYGGPSERYTDNIRQPHFSFIRPLKGESLNEDQAMHGRIKIMEDMSGFVKRGYFGTSWSYDLYQHMDHAILKNYVQNKFVVYDSVKFVDENNFDMKRLTQAFKEEENLAFVHLPLNAKDAVSKGKEGSHGEVIRKNSDQFQILKFDLNEIKFKTNFSSRKFVVYNDSYHPRWKAFINGKEERIWRSNVAFKGIWLEPGENVVYFRYGNPLHNQFFVFLAGFFVVFLGILGGSFVRCG